MAIFPISSGVVQLSTSAPVTADPFRNGIRLKSDNTVAYAATSGGLQSQNGFLLDVNGAVICVDATSGLPAGVVWRNGLPFDSNGALCISSGEVAFWVNGMPFALNGALAAGGGTPSTYEIFRLEQFAWYNGGATPGVAGAPRISGMQLVVGSTSYPTVNMTSDNTPAPLVASANGSSLGAPWVAFDGTLSDASRWIAPNSSPAWLEINLGAGNGILPTNLKIAPDGAAPEYSLQHFVLTGRNAGVDAAAATPLYYFFGSSSAGWTSLTYRDFSIPSPAPAPTSLGAYRFWRVWVTAVDGGAACSAAQVQMYTSSDGTGTNLAVNRPVRQTGDNSIGIGFYVTDGDLTGTEGGSAFTPGVPFSWTIDLASVSAIQSIAIISQRVVTGRAPKTFDIQTSVDGVNWFTAKSIANSSGWGTLERRVFSLL